MIETLIMSVVAALIAGWGVKRWFPEHSFGLVRNSIIGFIGAFLGVWLAVMLFSIDVYNELVGLVIVTFGGALSLIVLSSLLAKKLTSRNAPSTKPPDVIAPANRPTPEPVKAYNLKKIYTLLNEGFTDEELRQLCYYEVDFRPVYDQLAQETGKDKVIHHIIEYAERKDRLGILLRLIEERNPAQYHKHQPYT